MLLVCKELKQLKGRRTTFHVKTLTEALCIALACHEFSRKLCNSAYTNSKSQEQIQVYICFVSVWPHPKNFYST